MSLTEITSATPAPSLVSIGDTFGLWTVEAAAPKHPKYGHTRWYVRCGGCGALKMRAQSDLRADRSASCSDCHVRATMEVARKTSQRCAICHLNGHRAPKCPTPELAAKRLCESCGTRGHVRGSSACPNGNTPWRWRAHGRLWRGARPEPQEARRGR